MTSTSEIAFFVALAPCLGVAAFSVYGAIRCLVSIPSVPDDVAAPDTWPKLSLIVPACNEAESLEEATRAKLDCDYPNLEVVLIDDRSTDDTGKIADRIAESDPRVRVIHIRELPEGWLGKVHALHKGVEASSGEWVLFSDADVHLSRTLLRRVVAFSELEKRDFVALMPHVWPTRFWLDVMFTALCAQILILGRVWRVSDAASRAFVGGGVFALVRRAAYERTQRLEWLKLEVADDVGLGQMMKRSGARCAVYNGSDDVKLYFYRSIREAAVGFEKNGFAIIGRYSLVRHFLGGALLLWLQMGPAVGLGMPWPAVRAASALALACAVVSQLLVARWTRRPTTSALVPIFGPVALLVLMTRASILAAARGGVTWRGTRYSVAALREGQRLEFP